jgi:hypothetical protein
MGKRRDGLLISTDQSGAPPLQVWPAVPTLSVLPAVVFWLV